MTRIVINAAEREEHTVSLVGVEYLVKAPKSTIALALAQRFSQAGEDVSKLVVELDIWIVAAFGKKQAAKVKSRLDDPSDELDIPQIVELMQKLVEVATGDPSS